MKMHVRMFFEEAADLRGFVGSQVVQDDVDLLLLLAAADHLIEKANELVSGVPRCGLALDLAGAYI